MKKKGEKTIFGKMNRRRAKKIWRSKVLKKTSFLRKLPFFQRIRRKTTKFRNFRVFKGFGEQKRAIASWTYRFVSKIARKLIYLLLRNRIGSVLNDIEKKYEVFALSQRFKAKYVTLKYFAFKKNVEIWFFLFIFDFLFKIC